MNTPANALAIDHAQLEDTALVALARSGHRGAFRHIMQRCNQRLFRVARGVVNDDAEAEDVVQEAYTHAYEKLHTFRGEAALLTWMTRIVLNEAYGRLRQPRNTVDIDQIEASQAGDRIVQFPSKFGGPGRFLSGFAAPARHGRAEGRSVRPCRRRGGGFPDPAQRRAGGLRPDRP